MPIADYKVTDVERNAVYVQAQADTLAGTAAQNKAVFDAYPELVRDNLDGLCDFLANMPTSHTVSTAAATTAKTKIDYYVPIGAVIELIFTNGNTAAAPTISIDGVTHSISGLPTNAKLSTSANQVYRVKRTDGTTLTFLDDPNYTCEYGVDGSWYYERYANGRATCRGAIEVATTNTATFITGVYMQNGTVSLPTGLLNASPSVVHGDYLGASTSLGACYGYRVDSGTVGIQTLRNTNSAATISFFISVFGTWK